MRAFHYAMQFATISVIYSQIAKIGALAIAAIAAYFR